MNYKEKYKTLFKKPKTNLQNTVNKITEPKSYKKQKCPTLHSDGHSISIGISFFKVKRLYSG